MILVNDLLLEFGQRVIFDHISASFSSSQKVGLVGRNGAGKSTFLKILAGYQKYDSGSVSIERNKKLAYLPQEVVLASEKTVFDEAYSIFDELVAIQTRLRELEELFATSEDDLSDAVEEYGDLHEKIKDFDPHKALQETTRILKGLGFNDYQLAQPVSTMSEGWKMRVVLAKLLLQKADFYLFDEPTNHLDIVTKQWFLEFLEQSPSGFLLVTHDRYFLDHACESIYELERGYGEWYKGNFTAYVHQKEEERATTESAAARQQKEIARKQATINRFKASASRSTMAQSMMKQLEKIEIIEVEPPLPTVKINFPPTQRAGAIVLKAEGLSYGYEDGKTIFDNVSFEIQRGEKAAIVAPNGTGKTTLFNVLSGKYQANSGSFTLGYNVTTALFEQDQTRALTPTNTVIEEVTSASPTLQEKVIRGFMGTFLFSGDDVHKKIAVLSGGERNRVAMVKVLLQQANFLLLDEPTNHLDLYSKSVLLQALEKFDGTMLFVSHDQDFLNNVASCIIELTPHGVFRYEGNYDSYVWQKKQQALNQAAEAATKPTVAAHDFKLESKVKAKADGTPSQKELVELRKEMKSLENKIERLEADIATVSELFQAMTYGTAEYDKAMGHIEEKQKALKEHAARWEKLTEQVGEA